MFRKKVQKEFEIINWVKAEATKLSKTEGYNVSSLKRAQQKFKKSELLNDFVYGKKILSWDIYLV